MQKSKVKNGARFTVVILGFTFITFNFLGCVSAPCVIPSKPTVIPGVYHRVEKGQTLWGISKIYWIDLDEIIMINRISNASRIEVGQLIFIPHPPKPQPLDGKSFTEDFIWPTQGKVIATFGQTFKNMVNKGINIEGYRHSDVVAARSGKVVFYAPDFNGFGKTIVIDHGDGLSTIYARNSEVFVKIGDDVRKGALIGKVGSAGRDKNVYLHFEIRKGHIPQNPYFYLSR